MQWKIYTGERPWHKWFAWYPVALDHEDGGKRVWLEYTWRKKVNCQGYIISYHRVYNELPPNY